MKGYIIACYHIAIYWNNYILCHICISIYHHIAWKVMLLPVVTLPYIEIIIFYVTFVLPCIITKHKMLYYCLLSHCHILKKLYFMSYMYFHLSSQSMKGYIIAGCHIAIFWNNYISYHIYIAMYLTQHERLYYCLLSYYHILKKLYFMSYMYFHLSSQSMKGYTLACCHITIDCYFVYYFKSCISNNHHRTWIVAISMLPNCHIKFQIPSYTLTISISMECLL